MNLRDFGTAVDRRTALEKELTVSLSSIESAFHDEEKNIHCENCIGAVSIPLGIAGPLKLIGEKVKKDVYVPLATTEGALVASVSRGCKAIHLSGGAQVYGYRLGASRGPVFFTGSLEKNKQLYKWVTSHEKEIAEVGEATSKHLKLKKVIVKTLADYAFIRFSFDTDEAMGMNIVTIASTAICEYIEKEVDVQCLAVAGNFDIDKKPSWMNFFMGRGFKAWAEVTVPKEVLSTVLKTTAQKVFDVWLGKCMLGSAMSGSLGYNCHFANIVAAFYAATGQDLAHVVEGSHGVTTAQVLKNGDLYFSIYMPAVMLGTVGGGTKLKTQTEARNIIGVKTSSELVEVLAGAVLAGELSLLSSLSEKTLAKAHGRLGR